MQRIRQSMTVFTSRAEAHLSRRCHRNCIASSWMISDCLRKAWIFWLAMERSARLENRSLSSTRMFSQHSDSTSGNGYVKLTKGKEGGGGGGAG